MNDTTLGLIFATAAVITECIARVLFVIATRQKQPFDNIRYALIACALDCTAGNSMLLAIICFIHNYVSP